MASSSLTGLLVTHLPDVRYLCGFTGSSGALAVTRRAARFFTDGRYTAQAADEVHSAKVEIVPSGAAKAAIEWLAAQPGVAEGQVGIDSAHTSVAELARLKAALPTGLRRKLLKPDPSLVEPLRWTKDEDEVALMAEAAALGDALFTHLLGFLEPGQT